MAGMLAVILSRRRALYSTRRLREELLKLECEVRVIDPLKCIVRLSGRLQTVLANRRDLANVETVIPRVGVYAVPFILAVVRQFSNMGVPVLNSEEAIACARDKLRCLQTLVRAGIPVPDTLATRYPATFENMMALVGGPPVVLKLSSGSQGTGVILSESVESARSSLEAIWSLGADLMMQKFIAEARGRDLRVLVIDGEARAAMRRVAGRNEFRSNIHRGGVGEPVSLSPAYRDAAVRAAAAVGLTVAGVDILETRSGPLVIEVNASPGFQGLELATGLNIAGMIAEQAVAMARRPRRVRA
jgi:ribosomal protein S6--L-glutamate ligase